MRLLLSWLKEYVDFKETPPELKEKLILSGTNVEGVEKIGNEIVFNLEITPNRPDCLSLIGLAREVSVLSGQKLNLPKIKEIKPAPSKRPLKVRVEDFKLCPRYMASLISGLKIKPSPPWLQKRLSLSGIRPISNLVDITNYVMLEYGQPLHAFDYDKLHGKEIIIRRAKEKETIITLDGLKRALNKDILVIADSEKPIAIGGVMGGENTELSPATKTIVLEAANFFGPNINKTGRNLALRTESLDRFEKGLSPHHPPLALGRAIELILEIAGGKLEGEIIDIFPFKEKPHSFFFDRKRVEKLLGVRIPSWKINKILSSLGFQVKDYLVGVPFWRGDVRIEEDLIEEVGRIFGYDKIKPSLPSEELPPPSLNPSLEHQKLVRSILKGAGFSEVYNYSFISKDLFRKSNLYWEDALVIINPIASEFEYLRTSLVPSLLQNVDKNLRNFEGFRIFELSKIYLPSKNQKLPQESLRLVGAIIGEENLFYQAKGVVELLFEELGIKDISWTELGLSQLWHPGRGALIKIGKAMPSSRQEEIGQVGEIHPEVLGKFGIKKRTALFDLDFEKLSSYISKEKHYQPISKFPPVSLDLSLIVDFRTPEAKIEKIIKKAGGNLVDYLELFDVYTSRKIGRNKKSLTFRITYQSMTRTLNDEEVKKIHSKIIKALKQELGAEIRTK